MITVEKTISAVSFTPHLWFTVYKERVNDPLIIREAL